MASVKPLAVWLAIPIPVICGADVATFRTATGTVDGVRSMPFTVAKVGEMLMAPATVPVWMAIWSLFLTKMPFVEPAGMENSTTFPPLANWTDGSVAKTEELNARVRVPTRSIEYGVRKLSLYAGCCRGWMGPVGPVRMI